MKGTSRAERAFAPLQTLLQARGGRQLLLPQRLSRLYGDFRLPQPRSGFYVYSNFVSTLDGVVSLQVKGHSGGGDISGFSAQDRMVMGLLRAAADAVVVGSGTLAADPDHLWTAEGICPELKQDYRRFNLAMGKRSVALNVIVSASGSLNLRLPVFASGKVPAMVITTARGAKQLLKHKVPDSLRVHVVRRRTGEIPAHAILRDRGSGKASTANAYWSKAARGFSAPSTRSACWMNNFYRSLRSSPAARSAMRA